MLETIEFAAVLASALYGMLRAARKRLDVVGSGAGIAVTVVFRLAALKWNIQVPAASG